MKTPHRIFDATVTLLIACLMLAVTGCANTSLQRCYQSKQAYASTLETVADLRDAGVIPQSQVIASKTYRVAARAALDAWEAAAKSGDTATANTYEQKFKDASAFVQRLIDTFTPQKHSEADHGRSGYSVERHQIDRRFSGGGVAGKSGDYSGGVAGGQRPDRYGRRAA